MRASLTIRKTYVRTTSEPPGIANVIIFQNVVLCILPLLGMRLRMMRAAWCSFAVVFQFARVFILRGMYNIKIRSTK